MPQETLVKWAAKHEIPLFLDKESSTESGQTKPLTDRAIRGKIYTVCRDNKFNCVALPHVLEDKYNHFINAMHQQGKLSTLSESTFNRAGDIKIIRPCLNTLQQQIDNFVEQKNIPTLLVNQTNSSENDRSTPFESTSLMKHAGSFLTAIHQFNIPHDSTVPTVNSTPRIQIKYKETIKEVMPTNWSFIIRLKWAVSGKSDMK